MKTFALTAPAKLNLFLHINGRRTDGYHQLQTVFQLLDYGDTLYFTVRHDNQIHLHAKLPTIPTSNNLIIRAAHALQRFTQCKKGVDIILEKVLPIGGGLGGGSSDAATALITLNRLWELTLSEDELADLGRQLGADVPVFIRGQTAFAEGIGDRLSPIQWPKTWYLVIKPSCEVATAQVFAHKALTRNTLPITISEFFTQGGHNDCEPLVRRLYPQVGVALDWLGHYGSAQLTGTGSCVFAAFDTKAQAEHVWRQLRLEWHGFVAQGVNRSPAHWELEKYWGVAKR